MIDWLRFCPELFVMLYQFAHVISTLISLIPLDVFVLENFLRQADGQKNILKMS